MQPHHPFIGKTRIDNDHGFVGAIAKSTGDKVPDITFVWERLRTGDLDKETVWKAYKDNLKFVLESVCPFVKRIDGKTIITSDHGNAFGERASPFPTRVYGHGGRLRIPALVNVPWFVPAYDTRREIRQNTMNNQTDQTTVDINIEARLKALGYK